MAALPGSLAAPRRTAFAAARHRREDRDAAGVLPAARRPPSTPTRARRGDRGAAGRDPPLLALPGLHRAGSLRAVRRPAAQRDEVICVVEEPADLLAIERAGDFRGRYHVLHGTPGAARRRRTRAAEDLRAARAAAGRHRPRDHPRHQPDRRGRGDGALPRPAHQAARREGDAHRARLADGRRRRVRRRRHAVAGARGPPRDVSGALA